MQCHQNVLLDNGPHPNRLNQPFLHITATSHPCTFIVQNPAKPDNRQITGILLVNFFSCCSEIIRQVRCWVSIPTFNIFQPFINLIPSRTPIIGYRCHSAVASPPLASMSSAEFHSHCSKMECDPKTIKKQTKPRRQKTINRSDSSKFSRTKNKKQNTLLQKNGPPCF